jgi:hypothetical protein
VYAGGPPGAAGLVWQDDDIEFDLNAGNLVTTGAISTTISLGNPAPVCLSKNLYTLDIDLDLAALTGIPGLPTITLTGTTNATGDVINWSVGTVNLNLCLPASQTGLPVDILIKRITGGNLRVDATILGSPYFSSVCNRDFWVRMEDRDGNSANFLNIEAYAFCVESPFTRINATCARLGLHRLQRSHSGACQPACAGFGLGRLAGAAPTEEVRPLTGGGAARPPPSTNPQKGRRTR